MGGSEHCDPSLRLRTRSDCRGSPRVAQRRAAHGRGSGTTSRVGKHGAHPVVEARNWSQQLQYFGARTVPAAVTPATAIGVDEPGCTRAFGASSLREERGPQWTPSSCIRCAALIQPPPVTAAGLRPLRLARLVVVSSPERLRDPPFHHADPVRFPAPHVALPRSVASRHSPRPRNAGLANVIAPTNALRPPATGGLEVGGGAGNRTRVRKASVQPSFTCVAGAIRQQISWIRPTT